MKMFLTLLIATVSLINGVFGMDCTLGTSKNILDKVIHSCPRPIIDDSDEQYCCYSSNGDVTCCDLPQFIGASIFLFLPYIIALLIISFIISCVCCICCPFCCCYKRRSSGRVYQDYRGGLVDTASVTRIIVIGQNPPGVSRTAYQPLS